MRYGLIICIVLLASLAFAQQRQVMINEIALSDEEVLALELYYQVQVKDGSYWYDPNSGLVGQIGGPASGQILTALDLGQLSFRASGGLTDVVVNGRALHPLEVRYLMNLFGEVAPGYYWLDAQGNIGFEGGPALVNLFSVMTAQQGSSALLHRGHFGSFGSDGQCSYFMDAETGSSVMTSGC